MSALWEELKRRNVVRVAIAFAIVSWLVLQLTDVLMPILNLPEWVDGLVFLLLVIGFLLALFLSWAYELTPEGVKREEDVDRSASITNITGRKLDFMIIGILSVALAFFAIDKFLWTNPASVAVEQSDLVADVEAGPVKIAVLPFVNMSDDSNQEYFSDGLSEELLNLLAKIPDLRVTSRSSAFSFKDRNFTIAEVGEQLNVDHVLEGSVRRSGDTIRITAQLIEVATDAHQWSETWDRKFEDVFVIQDEIAARVVEALKLELLVDLPTAEAAVPEAYELVLEGSFLFRQANAPSNRRAVSLFKQALEIDPNYSAAWTWLGLAYFAGSAFGVNDRTDIMPLVREANAKALQLNPRSAFAHILRANVAFAYDYDFEVAASELKIAAESEPWNSQVHASLARLAYAKGDVQAAVDHSEAAHELDPLGGHRINRAVAYYLVGRVEEAFELYARRAELRPYGERSYSNWARTRLVDGDPEGALALLEHEAADGHQTAGRALVYQSMGDTVRARAELDKLLTLGNRWTYEIAEVYAYLGESDKAFEWLDRAIERRDGSLINTVTNTFLDNIRDDPRFDEILARLGRRQIF